MTDVKKLQNRMKFGEMEEETLEGVGKGMLKNSGQHPGFRSRRLRS